MAYSKTWTEKYETKMLNKTWSIGFQQEPAWTTVERSDNLVQTKSGQAVPEWRHKIARGEFAASPYSRSGSRVLSYRTADAEVRQYNSFTGYWTVQKISGCISRPSPASIPLFKTSVGNLARSRLLERIRGEIEHVNTLPVLGELRSTIRQLKSPFKSLLDLTHSYLDKAEPLAQQFKKASRKKRPKLSDTIAATYLEYAFGIVPLVGDTEKIAEALARFNAEKDNDLPFSQRTRFKLKSGAKEKEISHTLSGLQGGSPYNYYWWRDLTKVTTEWSVRNEVWLDHSLQADFGSNERLLQLLGFDPRNFVATAWELLPRSWLFDYFVNVQQIIEAGSTVTSNVSHVIETLRTRVLVERSSPFDRVEMLSRLKQGNWAWGNIVTLPPSFGSNSVESISISRTLPDPGSLNVIPVTVGFPDRTRQFANGLSALWLRRPGNSGVPTPFIHRG